MTDQGSPSSGGPSPKAQGSVPGPKVAPLPKPKAVPQTKSVTEDSGAEASSSISTPAQEALIAEAAKILKEVALKPLSVSEDLLEAAELDRGWLMGAISSASDPQYALVDSGATNALRSAREEELLEAKVIKVDLASGGTELHINKHGTLFSSGPCQVTLPAGYLVQLGFTIGRGA